MASISTLQLLQDVSSFNGYGTTVRMNFKPQAWAYRPQQFHSGAVCSAKPWG
jgi:hypothetical protein